MLHRPGLPLHPLLGWHGHHVPVYQCVPCPGCDPSMALRAETKDYIRAPYELPGTRAPLPWRLGGEEGEATRSLHDHHPSTASSVKPVRICATVSLLQGEQGGKSACPPTLTPPSPAPQLHQSESAPRLSFLFRKRLDLYCPGGTQNTSIPHRAVVPWSNPTEINSAPPAQSCTTARVVQSQTPPQ